MSGIAGIFHRDNKPVQQAEIQQMLSAISFRGPDARGVWTDNSVGLGHCLLYTTPESIHEKLPFVNAENDLVITADTRIDNRDELISLLGLGHREQLLLSDSEIILSAYEKWSEKCAERLIGDFAFAIWDKRKQRLYCAIDHFRAKPLCYFNNRDSFIFASQPSGLLPGNLVPDDINELRIGSVFFSELSDIDKTSSFYKHIFYIPAGSYLVTGINSTIIREYWSPNQITGFFRENNSEYQEEFFYILKRAINSRLRSNGPSALALSGGIDSNAIAALSRSLLHNTGKTQKTISALSFDETASIESAYIRMSVSRVGMCPVILKPEIINTEFEKLASLMDNMDSPLPYREIFLLSLYCAAKKNNVNVILDGSEGDLLLGLGVHYISHLFRNWRIREGIRESYQRALNTHDNRSLYPGIIKNCLRAAFLPNVIRPCTYMLKSRLKYRNMLNKSLINPAFAEHINLLNNLRKVQLNAGFGITKSINQMRLRTYNQPFVTRMPITLDMLSSACSVELRHPYMDKRLVEYCLGMPSNQKCRNGWEKFILREVTENLVPDEIRWRKRRDHVGGEYVMEFCEKIYPEIESIANDKNNRLFDYYDYSAIQNTLKRYNCGNKEYDSLLGLYGLHRWLN